MGITKADLPYWKRIESKGFSVYSFEEDKLFAAWENPDKSYSCFERLYDGNALFCYYENIGMFIKCIAWHDWIKEGIINDELAKLVENK